MDDQLIMALEMVRNGANTHKISNLVGSYRSLCALRDEIAIEDNDSDLLSRVERDIVDVESSIRVYLQGERSLRPRDII